MLLLNLYYFYVKGIVSSDPLIKLLYRHQSKCRHVKKFTCRGTLRQVFIEGDTVSYAGIFDPPFVICFISPPAFPCVNKYTRIHVYRCKVGGGGL
jgi:hypothetical protein